MPPTEFTMQPRSAAEIASRYGLELRGRDNEVVSVGTLGSRSRHRDRMLTFVTDRRWLHAFAASDVAAAVVPAALADGDAAGAADKSLLVTSGDPEVAFYELFADTAQAGEWSCLQGAIGTGTVVASSAVIEDGVVIGSDCTIMPGAVLLANTRLGDRIVVKPNATLGGDGFQVREIRGRHRVVPHTGGVDIGDDAYIGSQTCVDRGLFGDFTTIGSGAQLDNLVHLAHSARIGCDAILVACAEVSGSVTIGDGAWIGPQAAINASRVLGEHCFVGTGAVVVRDLPAYALAYGNPARIGGWMCRCRTKLELDAAGQATCARCTRRYRMDGDVLRAEQ